MLWRKLPIHLAGRSRNAHSMSSRVRVRLDFSAPDDEPWPENRSARKAVFSAGAIKPTRNFGAILAKGQISGSRQLR
jgi:hypothetical protein